MQETLFRCRNASDDAICLYYKHNCPIFYPAKSPRSDIFNGAAYYHGIVFSLPAGRGKYQKNVFDLSDDFGFVYLYNPGLHNQVHSASHKEKDSKGNRGYVWNCICGRRGLSAIFGQ